MLISKLKEGDYKAFRTIFSKYRNKVFFFSWSYLKSNAVAEDIVQDVFAKVWETRTRLDEGKSFNNFLFTVTKNTILNHIRKTKYEVLYRQNRDSQSGISNGQENDTLNSIICNDLQTYIAGEIEKLPPAMRKIYKLSRIQFLSNEEIARNQNLSLRTVENQIYRAVLKLKRKFDEEIAVPYSYELG